MGILFTRLILEVGIGKDILESGAELAPGCRYRREEQAKQESSEKLCESSE